jgi:hypothetical protein
VTATPEATSLDPAAGGRRLRAEFLYQVDKLLINPNLLGRSVTFEYDGKTFELAFPTSPADEPNEWIGYRFDRFVDAFGFPLPEGAVELDAAGAASGGSPDIASVDVVRFSVSWTAAVEDVAGKTATDVVEGMSSRVDSVFAMVFDVLRARGRQPWLGLTGTKHEGWKWRLLDLDRELRHPSPAAAMSRFWVVEPDSVLSESAAAEPLSQLAPISLSESLLADVGFFRWSHFPQAGAAAVLLAAIACEIEAKSVIRRTAGDRLEAVELLMSRAREFSGPARELFSKVMKAANGRSLKEEDSGLERDLGALFEVRNGIAHRSQIPTLEQAMASTRTAERVFEWLHTFGSPNSAEST